MEHKEIEELQEGDLVELKDPLNVQESIIVYLEVRLENPVGFYFTQIKGRPLCTLEINKRTLYNFNAKVLGSGPAAKTLFSSDIY